MARTHWHPKVCKVCGKSSEEVGPISQTGQCLADATDALQSNIEQMATRSGPNWKQWRRGMAACVGGVLLDDERTRP